MPKKTCYRCNEEMPLQMLAVHIKTCREKMESESNDESSDVYVVESNTKVVCPICNKEFSEVAITAHASLCGESFESTVPVAKGNSPCLTAETPVHTPGSVDDVLLFLKEQVDITSDFKLCVDRDGLPDRGIKQWLRKKTGSPKSALKVVYVGEAGVDTGALKKEFLTDMISGIENRFFEGLGSQGKNPKFSLTDLDNENFRAIGEIIAVSLAQGGPAPAFFKKWCYSFLCTGEVDLSCLCKDDVADQESLLLIKSVEEAVDAESLMQLAEDIVSCGYTTHIKLDNKESIIRDIVLHSTTRLIPILQQLRKGMELYGIVNQMAANFEACHALFVPGTITKPDADFIMTNCQPQYSEKGTSRERTERKIINFLQDFLEELEISVMQSLTKEIQSFSRSRLKKQCTRVTSLSGRRIIETWKGSTITMVEDTAPPETMLGYVPDTSWDLQVGVIKPYLLLGSQDSAHDFGTLRNHKVSHILNVAFGVDNVFPDLFVYKTVSILDQPNADLTLHIQDCSDFITQARNENGVVLVHCNTGISRAPAVAIGYLMLCDGLSFDDALSMVQLARPASSLNHGFMEQLRKYKSSTSVNGSKH